MNYYYFYYNSIDCFQELDMQQLRGPLLFSVECLYANTKKNNLIPLCEEGSIIMADIFGVGYMKCIQALPVRCKNSKENIAIVRDNENKSVLFLISINYRSCIAVAKGGEENIGRKTHLFVLQKPFDKARK